MKIKTVKDVHDVYLKIMENLVGQHKSPYFNLVVDHGDGNMSNCCFQPSSPIHSGQSFMAVDDIAKLMLLLLRHPNVREMEYEKDQNSVTAVFICPDYEEFNRLDDPCAELDTQF